MTDVRREYVAQASVRRSKHVVDVVRVTVDAVVTFEATCDAHGCPWGETWNSLDAAHSAGLVHAKETS